MVEFKVHGDGAQLFGINSGDVLRVDREDRNCNGKICIVTINGSGFFIRKVEYDIRHGIVLRSGNKNVPDDYPKQWTLWGVVNTC